MSGRRGAGAEDHRGAQGPTAAAVAGSTDEQPGVARQAPGLSWQLGRRLGCPVEVFPFSTVSAASERKPFPRRLRPEQVCFG